MSTEELSGAQVCCKKRFKGIENFLKRIAFNLGNTPSQTEVKIISCIPIDVTDLQQKIIHLEKQLEDATCALESPQAGCEGKPSKQSKSRKSCKPSVNTVILKSNFPNVASEAVCCRCGFSDKCTTPLECLKNKPKSNVSFVSLNSNASQVKLSNSIISLGGDQTEVERIDMENYYSTPRKLEPKLNKPAQTLFKKNKKNLKNKKGASPCVYYAQTYSSPFMTSNLSDEEPKYESGDVMTRSYLATMVSKQYKPEVLGDNISLHSQFSSPICKDIQSLCEQQCSLESDMCSCCHGEFHNIDEHANKQDNLQSYMVHQMNTGSAFYDTNQYDLIPVKEKPVKIKNDLERPRKKELRPYIDMKCWPENIRTKYHYQTINSLPARNYYTTPTRADFTIRDTLDSYGRRIPVTYNRIEPNAKILAKRRKEMFRRERPINIESSKSCFIDLSNVYPKKSPKKQECLQPIPVTKKNAECLTTVINNSECQTEMSNNNNEVKSAEDKTEVTLNQIKSILQSVLAEVKGASQTKDLVIQNQPKKDAVVQKGPSRNNMQASSLINSITYSPYTMNPAPFVTSCTRQMNPSQLCYPPGAGMKCFPVFIQNPGGRHMCSCCYRSSQLKPSCIKQATTTATNTEGANEGHSKETEKLIKEIYKSMALTMDFPNKDTSLSEYNDDTTKSLHDLTTPVMTTEPKKQGRVIKNVVQAVSELFIKKDMMESTDTYNSTIESKLPSREVASMQSHAVTSTDTEFRMRKYRLEKYMSAKNKQHVEPEVEKKTFREAMVQNANNFTESETSSSESDTTIVGHVQDAQKEPKQHVNIQKKEKQGLLTKMFKSVKLFKAKERPKKKVEKIESEEESTSDSDDYQTIYSQKIEKNLKHQNRSHYIPKRKTHSKISYKQTYHRDRSPEKKRSPYMEQENRRYWDEKLMFDNNRPRYTSEKQYSGPSNQQKSAYYQSYEARPVLVDHNTRIPKHEPRINREKNNEKNSHPKTVSKGMAWLKKHKMGVHCTGEQWKNLILDN